MDRAMLHRYGATLSLGVLILLLATLAGMSFAHYAWGAGEWRHEGKALPEEYTFDSKVETVSPQIKVSASKLIIECKTSYAVGKISAPDQITNTFMALTGCKSEVEGKEQCEVNTPGEVKEALVTKSLSGKVEVAAAAEAASERGIKLGPAGGEPFMEIEGKCLPTGYGAVKVTEKITNIVLAEIEPKTTETKVFTLKWLLKTGQQQLRKFPGEGPFFLELAGNEATLEDSNKIEFHGAACVAAVKIEVN